MSWRLIITDLIFLFIFPPLGILLLIIGIIGLAVNAGNKAAGKGAWKKCPKCAESVKEEATICHFCKYEFPPPPKPLEFGRFTLFGYDPTKGAKDVKTK